MKEVFGPTDDLLDEHIAKIDNMEEEKRGENFEMTQRETALSAAGENIQRNALKRGIFVGEDGAVSSRRLPRKRHLNKNREWSEILERALLHK